MEEQTGLSDQYRKASPWPLFIALGLAVAEVGVVFDLIPIAVGGILLLVGSLGGIMSESGYTATPWPFIGVLGVVFTLIGIALTALYPIGGGGVLDIGFRGIAMGVAGFLCMAGALGGRFFLEKRASV